MRFVPTNCIREGMILGNDLYNEIDDFMLGRGQILTGEFIESIKRLKYNGIYVDDAISEDLEIIEVINQRVRAESVKAVRDAYMFGEKSDSIHPGDVLRIKDQVEKIVDDVLENASLMVNIIDMKVFDDYTFYHSVNVAVLSIVLGIALGMTRDELLELGYAAILHDIGKVFIDIDILNKPDKLTDEEFEVMKTHSKLGCDYIQSEYNIPIASYVGIMDHHEKYSGGGYPKGIAGEEISRLGRIISLADVYDALTSDRPYRRGYLPSEAMEYIMANTQTLFDPALVEIFVKKIAPYPVGTCVRLSNGLVGIVVENYENLGMRPKVRIFQNGEHRINPYELQLSDYSALNMTVVEIT